VVTGAFRDLFAAAGATAGTLTGLLFVAVSVVPRRDGISSLHVIQQVRAAAALLAFSNALAVSLFGLVPGVNVGYPALVMGISGLLFTAAGVRSVLASRSTRRQQLQQLWLVNLLLLIFGTEFAGGIVLIADRHLLGPMQAISYAMVGSLFVGIARSWELVGDRDTGITASISVLLGRAPDPGGTAGLDGTPGHRAGQREP